MCSALLSVQDWRLLLKGSRTEKGDDHEAPANRFRVRSKTLPLYVPPLESCVGLYTEAVLWGCICIVPKRPGRRRKRRGRKPPIRTRFQVVPGLHNYIALVDIITCDLDRFRGCAIVFNHYPFCCKLAIGIVENDFVSRNAEKSSLFVKQYSVCYWLLYKEKMTDKMGVSVTTSIINSMLCICCGSYINMNPSAFQSKSNFWNIYFWRFSRLMAL